MDTKNAERHRADQQRRWDKISKRRQQRILAHKKKQPTQKHWSDSVKVVLKSPEEAELAKQRKAHIKQRESLKRPSIPPYVKGMRGAEFYQTREWMELRYTTLRRYGARCMCCNVTGVVMHVDHIRPRSRFPELELDPENTQVLCAACNIGKSNKDQTDWRTKGS